MNDQIKTIVAELLALEPSLKEKEAEVANLVAAFLAHKPETPFDANFALKLRRELLMPKPIEANPFLKLMPRYSFTVGALVVVALVVYAAGSSLQSKKPVTALSGQAPAIVALNKDAFGPLSGAQSGGGMGGGGNAALSSSPSPVSSTVSAAPVAVDARMKSSEGIAVGEPAPGTSPSWDYTQIEYKFDGDLATILSEADNRVYRRNFKVNTAKGSLITSALSGNLNTNLWQSADVQNISLVSSSGYTLFADLVSGFLSINRNYAMYKMMPPNIQNGDAVIPKADALIAAADGFLAEQGVSRDGYGDAVVTDAPVLRAMEGIKMMVPFWQTSFQVTYPLKIDGRTVIGWDGNPTGMTVSVQTDGKGNVTSVDSMNKPLATSYDASAYDLLTDVSHLNKVIERGSIYPTYLPTDANIKVATVKLGSPEMILTTYSDCNETCKDLYVPALRFPIEGDASTAFGGDPMYAPRFLVIPVVKSIIETAEQQNQGGIAVPMMK